MKIAIIGYGKMGHAIEALALRRGHSVACAIDAGDRWPEHIAADVAVEFTTPATAVENIGRCWQHGLPVVCGTTGWYDHYEAVKAECLAGGHRLLAATNFSLGMNIMFALNERLAELMRGHGYTVCITETHHIHKLDAPSGTALTLREQIAACGEREAERVPITSVRGGEVPGTHTVRYDSAVDSLILTHEAHSREGLAQGALLAAEWLAAQPAGVYTMKDIL